MIPLRVDRVRAALQAVGVAAEIAEFPAGTRTAEDAARALGTTVAQIVKSLIFLADGRAILVLVSGSNRVDLGKLAAATGARTIVKADADAVRSATGFAIGGVPPVGHRRALPAFLDRDLLQYDLVYAAAGTPRAVFSITPEALLRASGAQAVDLREE
ncbi:MAG: YbaK/EbsC family protein [Armatimonadetes bacterium]|nr:YbaK/EbsC family protein [Armatimonadota bacterium]